MNSYINAFLVSFALFFSCAVQSPPTGGAPDTTGPYIKNISPQNGTFSLNEKQNIEISFNEMIDPKTVKTSIAIFPEFDITINSYSNKIVVKPKISWPEDQTFRLKISRHISDFHGNTLNSPKVLTFSTSKKIFSGSITGKIFNHNSDISQIGLYKINNDNIEFVCATENNNLNEFTFNNIENGNYFILGVEGKVKNLRNEIKNYNYGLSTNSIYINNNSVNQNINFSTSASRLNIKSSNIMNENYFIIQLDNGENIHVINSLFSSDAINDKIIYKDFSSDSIDVDIKLKNNIESYNLSKSVQLKDYPNDLINPYIDNVDIANGKISLKFSEPVSIDDNNEVFISLKDSISHKLSFNLINPMYVEISTNDKYISQIFIDKTSIFDLSINKNTLIDSLITLDNKENYSDKKIGGNIFGKVIYEGKNEIIVEAIDLVSGNKYTAFLDQYGNYSFYNLNVSKYRFWAYENINPINNTYFNGTIEPLKYAARFGYYKGVVETRAKWDVEDIRIRIN